VRKRDSAAGTEKTNGLNKKARWGASKEGKNRKKKKGKKRQRKRKKTNDTSLSDQNKKGKIHGTPSRNSIRRTSQRAKKGARKGWEGHHGKRTKKQNGKKDGRVTST